MATQVPDQNLATAGLNQLIDGVDKLTAIVPEAIGATKDAITATAENAIDFTDDVSDSALRNLEETRQAYIEALRRVANSLGQVSPV